jgi:phenylalanine-4-hydroxylase
VDAHLIQLDRDHPGFRDLDYRRRRDAIARQALSHQLGQPAPHVDYTEAEHGVWRVALEALAPLHAQYACASFRAAFPLLPFSTDRSPQLAQMGAALNARTGFNYAPVAGLMSPREFMEELEDNVFLATQYMRHPSLPLYTPEPDVIHELVGHAPSLADPRYAKLNALFGTATRKTADEAKVQRLIRTYWYCLEFGLVREGEKIKAVGAGLLSSFGELGRFEKEATLLPFDLEHIANTPFDPTQYQATLFVADSEAALLAALESMLRSP